MQIKKHENTMANKTVDKDYKKKTNFSLTLNK